MTPLEPAFDTDRMRVGLVFVRTFFGEWDADIHGGEHGDVGLELLRSNWPMGGASSTL